MKAKKHWWLMVGMKYQVNQEYFSEVCNEVIDLLRKKHGLFPLQCHMVLKSLLDSLEETMQGLFKDEVV